MRPRSWVGAPPCWPYSGPKEDLCLGWNTDGSISTHGGGGRAWIVPIADPHKPDGSGTKIGESVLLPGLIPYMEVQR